MLKLQRKHMKGDFHPEAAGVLRERGGEIPLRDSTSYNQFERNLKINFENLPRIGIFVANFKLWRRTHQFC